MCDPLSAMLGFTALGSLSSANQANQAGKAAQASAQYNAQVSEAQAQDALRRGELEAGQVRNRTQQQLGRQATAVAGAGVDVSTGSALDLFADTAAFGSMDEQTVRSNAMREAYGYSTQATSQRMQGQNARQAGRNQATSSILGGAARGFNLWDQAG